MAKMFVNVKKGGTLNSADVATGGKYFNSIVFDGNTNTVWTHGVQYGSLKEAQDAIAGLKYFQKVTGDSGEIVGATTPGATLPIKGAGSITTKADTTGITITGTDTVNRVTSNDSTVTITPSGNDYDLSVKGSTAKLGAAVSAATTDSALAATDTINAAFGKVLKKVADAKKAGDDAASALDSYKTTNDAAVKAAKDQADKGVADADAALKEAQKKVASVTATTNKGIIVEGTATAPTVGIKIDNTTPGNVTLTVGANGLKAAVTIPQDKFVKSGSMVKGTWSGQTFTESTSGADTALKLVIAGETESSVYVNLGEAVAGVGARVTALETWKDTADPKINSALQTIRSANTGTYISVTGAKSGTEIQLTPSVTVKAMTDASSSSKGLAEASDVKSYVDGKFATADNALYTIGKGTDGTYVTTTVSSKSNHNQNVSVELTYGDYTTPTNGIAKVEDTKAYIDGLFTWEEL